MWPYLLALTFYRDTVKFFNESFTVSAKIPREIYFTSLTAPDNRNCSSGHVLQDNTDSAVQKFESGVTFVKHENYNPDTVNFDIAVLRLPTPLTFNNYVQPICLPSSPIPAGTNCVVTGWGETQSKLYITGWTIHLCTVADRYYRQTLCEHCIMLQKIH